MNILGPIRVWQEWSMLFIVGEFKKALRINLCMREREAFKTWMSVKMWVRGREIQWPLKLGRVLKFG